MLLALFSMAALQSSSQDPDRPAVQKQLRANDQALLNAIAPGDRAVWERLLAKDAVMHREEFLAALNPLPALRRTWPIAAGGSARRVREGEDLVLVRGE
jgi:hypothetical protein